MTSIEAADTWIGRTAVDSSGEQIGMITQIWVDDTSGQAEWASVRLTFARREALVPLAGAVALGGGRQFGYTLEEIAHAPQVAQDGTLAVEDKESVASYYGTDVSEAPASPSWMNLDTAPSPPVPPWMTADGTARPPARGEAGPPPELEMDPPAQKQGRRFGRKTRSAQKTT